MATEKSDVEIGKRPLAREQVYLCIMTNAEPPSGAPPRDALMNDHKEYLAQCGRKRTHIAGPWHDRDPGNHTR
jgi:hypothetical protein